MGSVLGKLARSGKPTQLQGLAELFTGELARCTREGAGAAAPQLRLLVTLMHPELLGILKKNFPERFLDFNREFSGV